MKVFVIFLVLIGFAGIVVAEHGEPHQELTTKDDVLRLMQDGRIIPPLNQVNLGVKPDQVRCNDGLILLQKYDGSPACVNPETTIELLKRGWTAKQVSVTFSGQSYECTVKFDRPDPSLTIKYPEDVSLPNNFKLIGLSTSSGVMTTLSYATPDFCMETNTMAEIGLISIDVSNPDHIKNGKEFVDDYLSENENNSTSFQLLQIHEQVGLGKESIQENFKQSPAKVMFYDDETKMLYTISGFHSMETLMDIALSLQ